MLGKRTCNRGATVVEYAILLMLISGVSIFALRGLGLDGARLYQCLADKIHGEPCAGAPLPPEVAAYLPPADGYYQAGDQLRFVVRFDDPISVSGGTPRISFDLGGQSRAAEDDGTGTGDLRIFVYTLQPGDPVPSDLVPADRIDPAGATIASSDDDLPAVLSLPEARVALHGDSTPNGPINIIDRNNSGFSGLDGLPDGGWYAMQMNGPNVYRFAADGSLSWARTLRLASAHGHAYDRMTALSDGGFAVAGSTAGRHYVTRVDADGDHVWTVRLDSSEVSGWGITALFETGLGHVVAVGSEGGWGGNGFIVRLAADGGLVSKHAFQAVDGPDISGGIFVTDAAHNLHRFAVVGELCCNPKGQFTLVLNDNYAPGFHDALYQLPDHRYNRHTVEPRAIAADDRGLGWVATASVSMDLGSPITMVQQITGAGEPGVRAIHATRIPHDDVVVVDGEIYTVGADETCPTCLYSDYDNDTAFGLARINPASMRMISGRYIDSPGGGDDHERLLAADKVGGGFVVGGHAHAFIPNTNINMMVGLLDADTDFVCGGASPNCGPMIVPPAYTPATQAHLDSLAAMDRPIQIRIEDWGAAYADVSGDASADPFMPAADDMHDTFPF